MSSINPDQTASAETIIATIRQDLLLARQHQNAPAIQALSSILTAIDNATAVDPAAHPGKTEAVPHQLSLNEVKHLIQAEIQELQQALTIYQPTHPQHAANLEQQLSTLKKYSTP